MFSQNQNIPIFQNSGTKLKVKLYPVWKYLIQKSIKELIEGYNYIYYDSFFHSIN